MTYRDIEHPHNNTRHKERTSYHKENFTLSCVILLGLFYPLDWNQTNSFGKIWRHFTSPYW